MLHSALDGAIGDVMSDDWNSEWYKQSGRRLPLWVVYAAAGVALIALLVVLVQLI